MDFVHNGCSINQSSAYNVRNECNSFADSVLLDYLTADYENISTEIKKEILFPETNDFDKDRDIKTTRKRKYSSLSDCVPIELFDNETGECIFHVQEKANNGNADDINNVLWETNSVVSDKIINTADADIFLNRSGDYDLECKHQKDVSTLIDAYNKNDVFIRDQVVTTSNNALVIAKQLGNGKNALLTGGVGLKVTENDVIDGLFAKAFEESCTLNKISQESVNNFNDAQQFRSTIINNTPVSKLCNIGNKTGQIINSNCTLLRGNKQENPALLNKFQPSGISNLETICDTSTPAAESISKSHANVTHQNAVLAANINAENGNILRHINSSQPLLSDYSFSDKNTVVRSANNIINVFELKNLPPAYQEKINCPIPTINAPLNIFQDKKNTSETSGSRRSSRDRDDLNDLLNQLEEHCQERSDNDCNEFRGVHHMIDHDYCLPETNYRTSLRNQQVSSFVQDNSGNVKKVDDFFAVFVPKTNKIDGYNSDGNNSVSNYSEKNNNDARNSVQRRATDVTSRKIDEDGFVGNNCDVATNSAATDVYQTNNDQVVTIDAIKSSKINNESIYYLRKDELKSSCYASNSNSNSNSISSVTISTSITNNSISANNTITNSIRSCIISTNISNTSNSSITSATSSNRNSISDGVSNSRYGRKSVVQKNKLLAYLLTADHKDVAELSKLANQYNTNNLDNTETETTPLSNYEDSSSPSSGSCGGLVQMESKLTDDNSQFSEWSDQSSTSSGVFSCFSSALSSNSNSPIFDAAAKDNITQNQDNSTECSSGMPETNIKNFKEDFGEITNTPSSGSNIQKQRRRTNIDDKTNRKDFCLDGPNCNTKCDDDDVMSIQKNLKKRHRRIKKERDNCFNVSRNVDKEPYASKERRILYVNKIQEGAKKEDLRKRFERFGPVQNISLHFRENGDNYGFITFYRMEDVFKAMRHANDDRTLPRYAYGIGGRREFCGKRYIDLDASSTSTSSSLPSTGGYHQFKHFEHVRSPTAAASISVQDDSYESLLKKFKMDVMRHKLN